MNKNKFSSLILTLLVIVLAFSSVSAQQESVRDDDDQNPGRSARPFRIMQELGLSGEQIQQIRRINQTRRPIMQEAQRRWRQANRDLDLAVYADNSTEEQIKELTRTAQLAQGELLKEKTMTEYLIRQVLTPEQLVKFRNLRQQLIEKRMNKRENPNMRDNPDRRQRRLDRLRQRRNQSLR